MGLLTQLSLLITDLDHTLVGNDESLDRLNRVLDRSRQTLGTKIVYATGRSRESYQDLVTSQRLLAPDALIAAVGTEIYLDASETPDPEWVSKLGINWHREEIVAIASRFADLESQPHSEQRPFKVSYFLSPSVVAAVVPQLQELLFQQGLDVEIIYSGSKDLDILPRGGDKGTAVQFLRDRWQIDPIETVVCGDSGNDISLFKYGTERGIVVGNAQSELRLWHELHPVNYHYLAVANYAAGILEGLKYFRFVE
ncbi:sucrose-phosphate phosphatase [Chamaesiphon sp. VAR_48_metabat_135_sub]|uniref:sucrose-phosphate phosphatase n=1 Tax=Chamaesiphon sp. VAR_48_metabat_135_sub TaxID=2964699 RepID=UPI00286AEF82|nr:sucrose-phosphate phosphatase [Chamaesiphon sp. VAR_48_metabat_135_sub]